MNGRSMTSCQSHAVITRTQLAEETKSATSKGGVLDTTGGHVTQAVLTRVYLTSIHFFNQVGDPQECNGWCHRKGT